MELFKELYEGGMNDKELAKKMGFTPSTIFTHRTKLGLPPQSRKNVVKNDIPAEPVTVVVPEAEHKGKDIGPAVFDVFYQVATACMEEHRDIRNHWRAALDYCNSKLDKLYDVFSFDDEEIADYLYQAVLTGAVREVPEEC